MRPLNSTLQRWLGVGALAILLPVAASAQQAYARNTVNLRAGPATNYPVVAVIGAGQSFQVLGCTQGYGWCDVVMPDGLRGWVYSEAVDYAYQQQRVPLATYGAAIGVPIIGFAIGSYWGNNYRDRPFYDDRRWWGGQPPPPRDGWRPPQPERPNWRPRDWEGPRPGQGGDFRQRPDYQPPNSMRPQPEYRQRDPGFRGDRDFNGAPPNSMRPDGGGGRQFDGGRRPPQVQQQMQVQPQLQVQRPQQPPPQAAPPQAAPPQAAPANQMRPRGGPPPGGGAGGGREGGGGGPGPGGGGGGGGGAPANSMRPG